MHLLTGQGSNTSTPTMRQEAGTPDWTLAEVQEFVPQGFEGAHVVSRSFRFVCSCDGGVFVFRGCELGALISSQARDAGILS
jgi:hypothetical protein